MAELKENMINGRFLLGTKFGSGAFGEIHMGIIFPRFPNLN